MDFGELVFRPMQLTFHTLDVFTSRRFGGNPLAVVLGADALSTEQMQTITREFNLSETILLMKPEDPANTAKADFLFPGKCPSRTSPWAAPCCWRR
jgi:trans-2,3-dihydro-3-hydroxyanthranilate isomerase